MDTDKTSPATAPHPPIDITWRRGMQFEAGRPDGPKIQIDGDAKVAPSPVDTLLAALATCAATDVVLILEKARTPAAELRVRIEATRVTENPRRLAAAILHFMIRGTGITRDRAERAIDLSVNKYCSVRASLATDIPVTWDIDLRG